METIYKVTREVYNEDGKVTTKRETIKCGNEQDTTNYFGNLITRIRNKADKCRPTENPNGYKLTFLTKKKVQATINNKLFVFELNRQTTKV